MAHARPRPERGTPEGPFAVFPLEEADRLVEALAGCTTVVQLIGTMRNRFAQGDTYETSDVGTTRLLVEAARRVPTVDHVLLLSSVGAGRPVGAYLKAKAAAEAVVKESGIPFTVFRPSALEGGERKPIPGVRALMELFGAQKWKPISLDELSNAMLRVALERAPLGVALEGASLWEVVRRLG